MLYALRVGTIETVMTVIRLGGDLNGVLPAAGNRDLYIEKSVTSGLFAVKSRHTDIDAVLLLFFMCGGRIFRGRSNFTSFLYDFKIYYF